MNVQSPLLPIVLVNQDREELSYLHDRLLEAGVENPLLTFSECETLLDYLEAVCLAALPRLIPCLMFFDFRLPRLQEMVAWVRDQQVLGKLKIVILDDEPEAIPAGADHRISRFPSTTTLAPIVVCACGRAFPPRGNSDWA